MKRKRLVREQKKRQGVVENHRRLKKKKKLGNKGEILEEKKQSRTRKAAEGWRVGHRECRLRSAKAK